MNKDNAAQYLPLVQALAEGKVIQIQDNDGFWYDSGYEPLFNLARDRYRIKPEPRKAWVWWPPVDSYYVPSMFFTKSDADSFARKEGGHIVEVTE